VREHREKKDGKEGRKGGRDALLISGPALPGKGGELTQRFWKPDGKKTKRGGEKR